MTSYTPLLSTDSQGTFHEINFLKFKILPHKFHKVIQ